MAPDQGDRVYMPIAEASALIADRARSMCSAAALTASEIATTEGEPSIIAVSSLAARMFARSESIDSSRMPTCSASAIGSCDPVRVDSLVRAVVDRGALPCLGLGELTAKRRLLALEVGDALLELARPS